VREKCVGASCSSNHSSTWSRSCPLPMRSATAASISHNDIFSNLTVAPV
jgi:hypothetical protein